MNFIYKIYKFMYGRNGIDDLYKALFFAWLILFVVNIFLKNSLLRILDLIIIIIMIYRVFSKNIYARRKENQKYLALKSKLTKPLTNIAKKLKDKDHVYKKCHNCKTILRLPLPAEWGIKHAKCPSCNKRITFLTFKYQKVEIIKK